MRIHLDIVGGLAGDMFIAGILDCFPRLADRLPGILETAGFPELVKLEIVPASDGVLTGTHFKVIAGDDAHGHHHRHYSEIKRIIGSSGLPDAVKAIALEIFFELAEAEAEIHGKQIDEVAFHEVGAWDSIADIVCAAALIAELGSTAWTISALPIGRGKVKTAHGELPVPAPATSLLLKGYEFIDDGISGERITPTGAAIIKYLSPVQAGGRGKLTGTGFGFGTKRFPGISNVVRVLAFEDTDTDTPWDTDEIIELAFEVDDETPEELAHSIEMIRGTSGVLDVTYVAVMGKKGRTSFSLRILARPEAENHVITSCFEQTTTLGIRRVRTERAILARHEREVRHAGKTLRIKTAERPGDRTTKAESDDINQARTTLAARRRLRREVETDNDE